MAFFLCFFYVALHMVTLISLNLLLRGISVLLFSNIEAIPEQTSHSGDLSFIKSLDNQEIFSPALFVCSLSFCSFRLYADTKIPNPYAK